MKGKIITGRGLSGLSKYVNKSDAEHIAGSCEPGDFLRTAAALRAQRPDVRQAAIHISISMPPGQPLTPSQWAQAGDILRREMKLEDCEYQLVRHRDTDHDHAHLIACKIKPDGTVWNDSHSARRLHRACEAIEAEMRLQQTLTVEQHRKLMSEGKVTKPMPDGALRQFQRTGTVPNATKEAIAKRIKNERENANRTTHRKAIGNHGILDESRAGNPKQNHQPGQKYPSPASRAGQGFEANRSAGSQTNSARDVFNENRGECWLEGLSLAPLPHPPSLSGRLHPRPSAGDPAAHDLYWQGRDRPTYRWHADSQQIQLLAKPTEANINAIFDLARESGLQPPLRVYGTQEFQRQACAEARRQGVEVQPASETVAREHDRALEPLRQAERTRIEAERAAAEHDRIEAIIAAEDREKAERALTRSKSAPGWRM